MVKKYFRLVIAMGDQQEGVEMMPLSKILLLIFLDWFWFQVDQLLIKLKRRQTPSKDLAILTAEALRKVTSLSLYCGSASLVLTLCHSVNYCNEGQ
jgi:hypothetical protein